MDKSHIPAIVDIQFQRITACIVGGQKRQNMPYHVAWTCPQCSVQHEYNLTDGEHYVSHPVFGVANRFPLYCPACKWEGYVEIMLDIVIQIIPPDFDLQARAAMPTLPE